MKPIYTDEARRRTIEGDVVLEIVVRRDGSVGDVRVLQGLGGGLNERAMQAVRQWRFAPARRLGPTDSGRGLARAVATWTVFLASAVGILTGLSFFVATI